MEIPIIGSIFNWESLEDSPSLEGVRSFLAAIPDTELLESLGRARRNGRNDYPVSALWGVVLLTIALRHQTFEACLQDLRRNRRLREMIGIESEGRVPKKWNVSRFLEVLGREPHRTLLHRLFDTMARRLAACVPDLGRRVAGDATSLNARRKRDKSAAKEEEAEGLPQAEGGRKEYKDDQGRITHVLEWFGFKLHLIVDTKHEVALGYEITSATADDGLTLPVVLRNLLRNVPRGRVQTLAFDKAGDSSEVHVRLHAAGIKPVIQNRALWKQEYERMLPGHDGRSNIVYDESGTVFCYDRASNPPVRHRMAYMGHEKSRGTLKYRCPAVYEGWECPSHERCNGTCPSGKTVRVKQDIDLRRFPAIPLATKQFERLYKERTSVERVNARFKVFWGVDDGNITGSARFYAYVGAIMVAHLGFATLLAARPQSERTLGRMRLAPLKRAMREKLAG